MDIDKATKKVLAMHVNNEQKAQVCRVFSSYVGYFLSQQATNNIVDVITLVVELFPYVQNTPSYKRLNKRDDTMWPNPTTSSFPHTVEPALGPRPGTDTLRAQDEDVSSVDQSDPEAVHVAKKLVQLFKSARKRNLEFGLDHEDVAALLATERCHYTDEVMKNSGLQQRTIDRLDNSRGYIKGNVVACTYQSNQLKAFLFEDVRSELFMRPETLLKMMFRMKMDRAD
jgi:hypothetical protein